jgi:hypothetical protein
VGNKIYLYVLFNANTLHSHSRQHYDVMTSLCLSLASQVAPVLNISTSTK